MKKLLVYIFITALIATLPPSACRAAELESIEALEGVVISELPENGALYCKGRELRRGSVLDAGELELIEYRSELRGEDGYSYIPVYSLSGAGESVYAALYSDANSAPTAPDVSVRTYKNATVSGSLGALDPEGDALEYRLLSLPDKGRLTLDSGDFVYTPYLGERGGDSFCYAVRDERGLWSREAVVEIEIERASTDISYADTDGCACEYAALRLAEAGVYTGRQVAGKYYFDGGEPVTRGDFIVMAACAAGYEPGSGATVFTDDAEIPAAARPYVTAAVSAGDVCGEATEEGLRLRSGDYITLAEAAAIAGRLMGGGAEAAGAIDLPQWAAKSAARLGSCAVLSRIDADCTIDRAGCAELLVAVLESREAEKGLFSWIGGSKA